MEVYKGKKGLMNSWQDDFPETTKCIHCKGSAFIAFVATEFEEDEYICDLHPNEGAEGGKYWLHDVCAVAIYFCEDCLEPTAEYNQA